MTITNTSNRVSFTGNSVTTTFPFAPPFFAQTDLVVLTVDAAGNTLTKMLTTDYTVTGTQDATGAYPNGGAVVFNVAPATGLSIVIYRDPLLTQSVNFVDNDNLPAASINGALDKLTVLEQRSRDIVTRSLRQPDGDTTTINAIPAQAVRANGGLGSVAGYDALGNTTIYSAPGQSVSVSTAMAPVVTAATLALGRTALGSTAVGDALFTTVSAAAARALLNVDYGDGTESDGSTHIRVKLDTATDSVSGLLRGANGLRIDPSFDRGYITGFECGAPGAGNVITIGPGVGADSTNTHLIKTTTTFTKSLASFVAGTGNGGLDTGTTLGAINTPYFVLAVLNPTSGATDYILSLSATAPTLPTGFTIFRVVGWGKTDGSKNFLQIQQRGDDFIYGVSTLDASSITVGTAAVLTTLTVPLGFQVNALFHAQFSNGTAGASLLITSPDESDQAPSAGIRSIQTQVSGANATGEFEKRTNVSGQIRSRGDTAANTVSIGTYGFRWSRGRNS